MVLQNNKVILTFPTGFPRPVAKIQPCGVQRCKLVRVSGCYRVNNSSSSEWEINNLIKHQEHTIQARCLSVTLSHPILSFTHALCACPKAADGPHLLLLAVGAAFGSGSSTPGLSTYLISPVFFLSSLYSCLNLSPTCVNVVLVVCLICLCTLSSFLVFMVERSSRGSSSVCCLEVTKCPSLSLSLYVYNCNIVILIIEIFFIACSVHTTSVCPKRRIPPLLLFIRLLPFFPHYRFFWGRFSLSEFRVLGQRMLCCTDSKAACGKFVIFDIGRYK